MKEIDRALADLLMMLDLWIIGKASHIEVQRARERHKHAVEAMG